VNKAFSTFYVMYIKTINVDRNKKNALIKNFRQTSQTFDYADYQRREEITCRMARLHPSSVAGSARAAHDVISIVIIIIIIIIASISTRARRHFPAPASNMSATITSRRSTTENELDVRTSALRRINSNRLADDSEKKTTFC